MVESIILMSFAAMLVAGIVMGIPLLATLVAGLVLFCGYGIFRGHGPVEVAKMATEGVRTIGGVLVFFVIIGALTASWRAAGTIPAITCWSASLVSPETLVVVTFLLCAFMSMVTGSSYASAATVGVICLTIGTAMKADLAIVGGAILAGSFVGDRCSPLSSAAALVATITHTQVFDNVRRMVRTGIVPFALSCCAYVALGPVAAGTGMAPSFEGSFASSFDLSWVVVTPIALILALSLFKVNVKATMLASLAAVILICVFVQHTPLESLPSILLFGYKSKNLAIARMVNGGGILSMAEIIAIVGVASTYSGLFSGTGLLVGLHKYVTKIARRSTPFISVLATSIATCTVACDQVVAIMLTSQLCDECERSASALALDLENSAAIISSVIPWSTSCIGIIAFVGMPMGSVAFNFLTFLIPLWTLAISIYQHAHPGFTDGKAARLLGLDKRDDVRLLLAEEIS
jgi:NhaC family Na+:H+ antiporter